MRRRNTIYNNRNSVKKEKAVMILSTVLVLTALTVTGFYVRNGNEAAQDDGYTLDFSALETESQEPESQKPEVIVPRAEAKNLDDDLDYDPDSLEADSNLVENAYGLGKVSPKEDISQVAKAGEEDAVADISEPVKETPVVPEKLEEPAAPASAEVAQPELHFQDTDTLMMPLSGNILMNYSMDSSVYFKTLQQYKYNPAVVLEASVGTSVKAAANGKVTSIRNDAVTGNTVVMDIGDGYELTYGQLDNITVSEGTYVKQGDVFASIAAPSRYYTEEGSNLYLKMTKDGEPVNPIAQE